MPYTAFLPLINSVGCILLAIFILSRNLKHPVNVSFALGISSLGLMEFANCMVLLNSSPTHIMFWARLARIGECLLPGSWALFSYTFARKEYREVVSKQKIIIALFYVVPLLFLGMSSSNAFLTLSRAEGSITILKIERIGYYFYLLLCFSMIFILARLEGILRSSKGAERWQIKYAILGLGSIFASFIFIISQRLLYRAIDLNYIPAHSVIILISLSLVLFAAVRHRLMEVDIFISRYAVYGSLTVLFVGIYFLAMGLVGEMAKHFGLDISIFCKIPVIFASALFLLFLLLSDRVSRTVKYLIVRNFYKNKYDYRSEWLNFSKKLSDKFTAHEICEATLELLVRSMYVREMSIWLYDEEKERLEMASSEGLPTIDSGIGEGSSLISYIKRAGKPFIRRSELEDETEGGTLCEQDRDFFEKTNASLCVPMMVGHRLLGLITVGPEFTGKPFIEDDFDLVTSVVAQASNALLNSRLFEQLVSAKEEETFHRLSSFIIHDLKNYVSMLSLIAQNAEDHIGNPEFQKDALNTISNTISQMKALMSRLSFLPKELGLNLQKFNLNTLVTEAADNVRPNGSNHVNIRRQFESIPPIKGDVGQLRKVVTNLVLNAMEAMVRQGEIILKTYLDNGWAIFSISDNGPGMDEEFKDKYSFKPFHSTKEKGLGIGLFQCKTIVEAHGGKIEVENEKGKGCTFKVKIPSTY
jgi:putative PEP-CTERM system histidine kinase